MVRGRARAWLAISLLAGCSSGGDSSAAAGDGDVDSSVAIDDARGDDASDGALSDTKATGDGAIEAGDSGGACSTFPVALASLVAHNTSASPHYDQAHFGKNFGTTTWVTQSGTTMPIDPAKVDRSLNAVTPAHVSSVDVHTLIPSRPDLRWFAHITPWFRDGGGGGHVDIGLEYASAAYVASMIDDMKRRGFDGLIVDWYGKGSYSDQVTLLIQKHLASLTKPDFKFIVMMDKGIAGLSQSVLETQIEYCKTQYFGDPSYELEGGKPILMFFGVDGALGGTAMASAKAATGGAMVWVTQGASSLGNSWVDQAFDWTHDWRDGASTTDPYNLAALGAFHASVKSSSKKAFGSMVHGFDGTLTNSVGWSMGKYLPQGNGACLVQWAKKIDAVIPPNVTRIQWATWSDWEEGTAIEPGVENDLVVAASVSGSTLTWTVKGGTGDESTLDHYEIYASADGTSAVLLGTTKPGTRTFDLHGGSCRLASGTSYRLVVDAVGKPNIRDHVSPAVTYAP